MPIFSHPALLRLANEGAFSQADLMAVFGTWIDEIGTLMVDLHFALMDQVEKRVWISETITGVGPVDVAGLTLQF